MSGSAQVIRNMYAWAAASLGPAGIEALARVTAANAQNYARIHHPWQTQSGAAVGMLHGGFYWENKNVLKVYIAHGVEYGIYLELAHDRKYQILEETVKANQDSFYNGVKKIMGV